MTRVLVLEERVAAARAADLVCEVVSQRARSVIGLATGSTPRRLYEELAARSARGVDFSQVRFFALDEYLGLPAGHPRSYRTELLASVISPLRLAPEQLRTPDAQGPEAQRAAEDYEAEIAEAGGIDLQILGIGANGHIGFNEPGSSLSSRTRPEALAAITRADNARFFDDGEVPRMCLTQGIGTIREARRLVLLAFGARKSAAVAAAVEGPVTSRVPASALQLHPDPWVLLDEGAASDLRYRGEYEDAEHQRDIAPGR